MEKVFILAGSITEAAEYGRRNGMRQNEVRYIDRPEQMRGIRGGLMVKVGTWYKRKNAADIIRLAQTRGIDIKEDEYGNEKD